MKLDHEDALARLMASDHGVLCTVHPVRGVDGVPCVFAVDGDGFVAVPVDRVKAKSTFRLQRELNLEADPRAALVVEGWDREDWSRLWWVRASLEWESRPASQRQHQLVAELLRRFPQYSRVELDGEHAFERVHVLRIQEVTGWAASG